VQQIGWDGKVDPVGSCPKWGRDTRKTKFGRHGGCNTDQAKVFAQECKINAKTPLEKQGCQTEKVNGINKRDADKWCHTKWASCWAVYRWQGIRCIEAATGWGTDRPVLLRWIFISQISQGWGYRIYRVRTGVCGLWRRWVRLFLFVQVHCFAGAEYGFPAFV
jgi:hypothetical protein